MTLLVFMAVHYCLLKVKPIEIVLNNEAFTSYLKADHPFDNTFMSKVVFNFSMAAEPTPKVFPVNVSEEDKHFLENVRYYDDARTFDVAVFADAYFDSLGLIGRKGKLVHTVCPNSKKYSQDTMDSAAVYDTVIDFVHIYSGNIYHFLVEGLAYMLLMPMNIVRSSKILLVSPHAYMYDGLKSMNIPVENAIVVAKNHLGYAHSLYTIKNMPCGYNNPLTSHNLRNKLVKLFDLDNQPPHLYVIHSRSARARRFINIKEIHKQLLLKYPNHKFTMMRDVNNFSEQFKFYNQIKVLIAIHGANLVPTLAMQKNSVLCEIFSKLLVPVYSFNTRFNDMFYIYTHVPEISQFGSNKIPIPPDMVFAMVDKALELV